MTGQVVDGDLAQGQQHRPVAVRGANEEVGASEVALDRRRQEQLPAGVADHGLEPLEQGEIDCGVDLRLGRLRGGPHRRRRLVAADRRGHRGRRVQRGVRSVSGPPRRAAHGSVLPAELVPATGATGGLGGGWNASWTDLVFR